MNFLIRQDLLPARGADRYEVQRPIVALKNPIQPWWFSECHGEEALRLASAASDGGSYTTDIPPGK
jgi:hypothetical protein